MKLLSSVIIGLFLLLCVSCPKEPPPFESEGGDNGGVTDTQDNLAVCEENLVKAMEEAQAFKELAETCVDEKVKVKR